MRTSTQNATDQSWFRRKDAEAGNKRCPYSGVSCFRQNGQEEET